MKTSFKQSAKELETVRGLVFAAMFIALSVAVGHITDIQITNTIRIGFSFLPQDFGAFFMGPVVGGIINGLADLITFIMKPIGAFFPGYTFSAVLNGIIVGAVLYRRPVSLKYVFLARLLNNIIVNLIFNTLWSSMLYGDAFLVLLPARALKQLFMLPVETAMLYIVMKAAEKAGVIRMFRNLAAGPDSAPKK